jgi:methylmalonyl-CoA mutase
VQAALDALTAAAEKGNGNLLDLSIQAIRLRATVGEVSDALERFWAPPRRHAKGDRCVRCRL